MKNNIEKKPSLIILDIGSHKLEELQVFLNPYYRQLFIYLKWLIKLILKVIFKFKKKYFVELKNQLKVIDFYFVRRSKYNVTIITIEPNPSVLVPYIKQFSKNYKVIYFPVAILGHDSLHEFDLKILYSYGDSISHSLYDKKRPNTKNDNICVALKLNFIWNGLIKNKMIDEKSEVILRMNCEGAELGILKECDSLGLRIKCLIGSIGDITKIHGSKKGEEASLLLQKMNCNYYYFKGDDPATWYSAINVWSKYTNNYII